MYRLCFLNSDNVLCSVFWNDEQYEVHQYYHVGSQISSLLIHPNRCECVCGGGEGIRIWNLKTKELIKQLSERSRIFIHRTDLSVTTMCWLFNGFVLAVGTHDGMIHFYDPSESCAFHSFIMFSYRLLDSISAHKSSVICLFYCSVTNICQFDQ